jgi:hypothetical protein
MENLKEKDYLRDLSTDGKIILQVLKKQGVKIWTGLMYLQKKNEWWDLVNMIMNTWVPQNLENFLAG